MSSEKRIDFLDFGTENSDHFRPFFASSAPVFNGVGFLSVSEKVGHYFRCIVSFNPVEIIEKAFVVRPLPERLAVSEDANQKTARGNLFFSYFRSVCTMSVKRFKIHQKLDKVVGKLHHLLAFPLEEIRDIFDNSADDHASKTGNQSFHFDSVPFSVDFSHVFPAAFFTDAPADFFGRSHFFKAVQFAVTGIAMRAKTLAGFIAGESSPDVKLNAGHQELLLHFPLFPFGALALFHFNVFFRPVAMEKVEEK